MNTSEQKSISEKWQVLVGNNDYEGAYRFVLVGMQESKAQNNQKKLDWYARFLRGTTVLVESNFEVTPLEKLEQL